VVSDDEILCLLDPGRFSGGRPDLGVWCHLSCLERPCLHTYELLAALNGWEPLRPQLERAPTMHPAPQLAAVPKHPTGSIAGYKPVAMYSGPFVAVLGGRGRVERMLNVRLSP